MGLVAVSLPLLGAATIVLAASDEPARAVPGPAAAEIQRAVTTGNAGSLEDARVRLRSGPSAQGLDEAALYLRAYVAWRLSYFHPRGSERSQALLGEAEQDLDRVLSLDPGDAEALALLGSAIGSRITGVWSGLSRGPRAARALDRAFELAPDNPRVVMLLGISRLYRPAPFGGGIARAEQELERARALFAHEPAEAPWPNWGRAEVLAWLGQTALRRGDLEKAGAFYRQALEIEPDYDWVCRSLLPELAGRRTAASGTLAPGSWTMSPRAETAGTSRRSVGEAYTAGGTPMSAR